MAKDLGIDLKTFCKQCRIFELLDEQGRQRMMNAAEQVHFGPGASIMQEGEPGDAMFVVQRGTVRISIDAVEGNKTVAHLGNGSVVGEIAMVSGQPRSATVVAEDEVALWRFEKTAIDTLLAEYPVVREALTRLGLKRSELTLEKMLSED